MDLLYFIILTSSLIFVHELGHFMVAKAFGVKVLTFSLGFGPKILNWLCNYGFVYLNLNRIYGYSIAGNERILRVNEKEGWVLEGTLRGSIHYKGEYLDQHVKSMLRGEWEKQPWMSAEVGFEFEV